ncbi:hypothetical protein PI124_g10802 [Phytophthora idaei]|nr:hypothetical protein PI125_g22290 [Phytophthora idaei]KAG3139435.1 hypothetical protein PI126_g16464 [Phytophthora idaei]KAG3244412.1 hypothetical protein PI124_g10802 [Phytophthora idaei]
MSDMEVAAFLLILMGTLQKKTFHLKLEPGWTRQDDLQAISWDVYD